MPYERRVERAHPALIVMALDDSGSMASSMEGTTDARYSWVERYTGIILRELLTRSTEVAGENPIVKPRYYFDVIKYGSSIEMWPNRNNGGDPLDIGEVIKEFGDANATFGLGGSLSGTDTAAAFKKALSRLETAVKSERFKESFPPILFHLTDGESHTDAEPIAQQIMNLASSDGNVLIVNAYIGTHTNLNYTGPNDFPGYLNEQEVGSAPDNLRLFRMSSIIPKTIHENLVNDGIFPAIRENARLFFDVRTKEMLKYVIQVVGSGGSRLMR